MPAKSTDTKKKKQTKTTKIVVKRTAKIPEGTIDLGKALQLRLKNKLSYPEIAKVFGVTHQSVYDRIQGFMKHIDSPDVIEAFEKCKPEILSSAERQLLEKMLDPEKMEKANLNNVAYAFTQINNANRLERGQATAITDDVDAIIQRVESRYAQAKDITPIPNDVV